MSLNYGGDPPKLSVNTTSRQFNVSDSGKSDLLVRLLVGETAHDLRSLACNFRTRLYLAQQLPEQSAKHLADLNQLMDQLDALVNKLATVSRSGVESLAQEPQLLNLNDIVARVVEAYQPVAEIKGVALSFDAARGLQPIFADKLDIERVVMNLLCNALNYTPAAGSVTLATSQIMDSVMFTAQDTGIGISSQALPHIFERSYRSEEARNMAAGTGLGLAIVLRIVEKYGGHIDVDSTPGMGSIFKVYLPVYKEPFVSQ